MKMNTFKKLFGGLFSFYLIGFNLYGTLLPIKVLAGGMGPAPQIPSSQINQSVTQIQNSTSTSKLSLILPTRGLIYQGFHPGHYALDIANPSSPSVWAAQDGIVVKVLDSCLEATNSPGCGGGYGNHIIIKHSNGMQTLYGHLASTQVKVGDSLKQGDIIGKMGSTGNTHGKNSLHLHFEVRDGNKKVNPANFI